MTVGRAVGYVLLSLVVALIAAFVSVRRGGTPFPVTRGTKAVASWVLRWVP